MRKNYKKHISDPKDFLENVLNTWTAFCEVNYSLATAISICLTKTQNFVNDLLKKKKPRKSVTNSPKQKR